jgi:hypothetical protein
MPLAAHDRPAAAPLSPSGASGPPEGATRMPVPEEAQIGISAGTGQPGKVGYNGGANGSRTLCHAVASSDRLIAGGKNCGPPGSLPAKPPPGHPHPASANGRHRLAPSYEAGWRQDTRGWESGNKSAGCARGGDWRTVGRTVVPSSRGPVSAPHRFALRRARDDRGAGGLAPCAAAVDDFPTVSFRGWRSQNPEPRSGWIAGRVCGRCCCTVMAWIVGLNPTMTEVGPAVGLIPRSSRGTTMTG